MGVNAIDRETDRLDVTLLELGGQARELDKFGRADRRKVRRVREQQHPFPSFGELGQGDLAVGAQRLEVRSWVIDARNRLSFLRFHTIASFPYGL